MSDLVDLENGSSRRAGDGVGGGGVGRTQTLFNAIMDTLSDPLTDIEGISLSLSQFANDGTIWTKHTSAELAVKITKTP